MKRSAIAGALGAAFGAVPLAALCGLVYRFPVPFVGYASGAEAVAGSLLAALFYGVFLGGLPFLALLGAGAGAVGWKLRRRSSEVTAGPSADVRLGLLAGLGVAAAAVGLLANLDHLIGPW